MTEKEIIADILKKWVKRRNNDFDTPVVRWEESRVNIEDGGYIGFSCDLVFDTDGSLKAIECYEC